MWQQTLVPSQLPNPEISSTNAHMKKMSCVLRAGMEDLVPSLPGDSIHQSLLGRNQHGTPSTIIIRLLIWSLCSWSFMCRATLLLLGPLRQTTALSGSPGYSQAGLTPLPTPQPLHHQQNCLYEVEFWWLTWSVFLSHVEANTLVLVPLLWIYY